jgi:hypothetical protein
LRLDSLDLANIEMLIKNRIKELREFKAGSNGAAIPAMIADEQLAVWRGTLKKIVNARADIRAFKATEDAKFYARQAADRSKRSRRKAS